MDGHFVPNLTIGPPVIKALRKHSSLKFDVHLMISPVHKYIEAYADAGADIITIHPEATVNLSESISKIKELKKKVGVSLNPKTKIDVIKKYLNDIDLVLIMSVHPGFGGQKFMPEVLDKIQELKTIQKDQNLSFILGTHAFLFFFLFVGNLAMRKVKSIDPKKVGMTFLTITVFKMLSSIVFILVIKQNSSLNKNEIIFNFFGVFFLYLIYEVITSIKELK
jgi:F0F1-type ATP synthase assembly protein I